MSSLPSLLGSHGTMTVGLENRPISQAPLWQIVWYHVVTWTNGDLDSLVFTLHPLKRKGACRVNVNRTLVMFVGAIPSMSERCLVR